MSRHESEEVMESVIEHHAGRIGIDADRLIEEAFSDRIIVAKHLTGDCSMRYQLAGSLEEFCVYAERLAANS